MGPWPQSVVIPQVPKCITGVGILRSWWNPCVIQTLNGTEYRVQCRVQTGGPWLRFIKSHVGSQRTFNQAWTWMILRPAWLHRFYLQSQESYNNGPAGGMALGFILCFWLLGVCQEQMSEGGRGTSPCTRTVETCFSGLRKGELDRPTLPCIYLPGSLEEDQ